MSLQNWERKAEEMYEKIIDEKPSKENAMLLAASMTIMAGAEIGEILDMKGMGGRDHYDGRRDDYYRGRIRRTGRYVSRYDGMGGGRSGGYYDDGMDGRRGDIYDGDREMYDDDMESEEYYNGRGVSRRDGRRYGARGNIRGGVK